jgi:transposase InsO family protein/transposase
MKQTNYEARLQALALLQAGHEVSAVAKQLKRTPQWVRKVRRSYKKEGVKGLIEKSRKPKRAGKQTPTEIREAIILARLKLEAAAQTGAGLKYVGGQAIRTYLEGQKVRPLPSVATIERVLRSADMTRPKEKRVEPEIGYPRLHPSTPQQLVQVDIVPHYLQGGERVACFNGIDVVSRYATGQAFAQRRSMDAERFLVHLWQTVGIPQYTQLDNEGCFSGGATHPYVLGRVLRLALQVGTELVFSPFYHPKSNGTVERFHQEYDKHVWDDTYLADFPAVNRQAEHFFALYNQSGHHSRLKGEAPTAVHHGTQPHLLADDFPSKEGKLPLTEGKVHFMRCVQPDGKVRVLNVDWAVPAQPYTGVWATLDIRPEAALLSIYDTAPDAQARICLASYPFPLPEKVMSRLANGQPALDQPEILPLQQPLVESDLAIPLPQPGLVNSFFRKAAQLTQTKLARAFFRIDQLIE